MYIVATLLDNMWLVIWDTALNNKIKLLSIVKCKFNILRKEHAHFIEGTALRVTTRTLDFTEHYSQFLESII